MSRYVLLIILLTLLFYIVKLLLLNSPSDRSAPKDKPVPPGYQVNLKDTVERLKEDVQMLAGKIGERSIFSPVRLKEAEKFVKSRLQEYGTVNEYPYTYNGVEVANLELDIFTDDGEKDILIIGAHYDTVSSTPGADDNASAVAVLLELARHAQRLKTENRLKENVRFMAFPLEEPPAFDTKNMGSKQYVEIIKERKDKIKGMICLEMVGFTNKNPNTQEIPFPLNFRNYPKTGDFIAFLSNLKSVTLLDQMIALTGYQGTLLYEKLVVPGKGRMLPISRLSDHISFWDKGYPAVMVTDTSFLRNPHYHGPGDRPETLDYHFMAQLVQTLILLF